MLIAGVEVHAADRERPQSHALEASFESASYWRRHQALFDSNRTGRLF
jgi:hypothetical protein